MKHLYLLLILLTIKSFGQERQEYKLRIIASDVSAFPLTVINETTQEAVTTDGGGYFTMNLKTDDGLALEENDYYQMKYQIRTSDLASNIIRLYPEPKTTLLKEIEIRDISTKSLGIDSKTIIENTPTYNLNTDFKGMFLWLVRKIQKKKTEAVPLRKSNEMNPYVAGLPRSFITDYLKIPEEKVEKFYYFMNDDYEVDEYIKQGQRPQWEMHLFEKALEFMAKEETANR